MLTKNMGTGFRATPWRLKGLQLILVSMLLPACNPSESPIFAAKRASFHSPEQGS